MSRSYAIIPAAGRSSRMGQHKLLLPWNDWTVMDQLLSAWTASRTDKVVVVVRRDDDILAAVCRRWPVHLVQPSADPADMRESVVYGLSFVQESWQPEDTDRFFVAPADLPGMRPDLIDRLLQEHCDPIRIVVPCFGDRTGHPALLPWPMSRIIRELPKNQGIDRIMRQNPPHHVSFPEDAWFGDIDSPDDYEAARRKRPNE